MRSIQFLYGTNANIPRGYGSTEKPIKKRGSGELSTWYASESVGFNNVNGTLLVEAEAPSKVHFEAEMHYARGDICSILASEAFTQARSRALRMESWKEEIALDYQPWFHNGALLYFAAPPVNDSLAEKIATRLATPRKTDTDRLIYLRNIVDRDGTVRGLTAGEAFAEAVALAQLVERVRSPISRVA